MSGQGGSQTQVTGDGMQGLGRSIGNLVQQHLQHQQVMTSHSIQQHLKFISQ